MAGIDTQKPHLAVYPWPVGFDQPDSPNYIPTREIVQSCHGIGNSYHQWRNVRFWARAALFTEVGLSIFSDSKTEIQRLTGLSRIAVSDIYIGSIIVTVGVAITAEIFSHIRSQQYKKCADDVGNEMQRRHDAEVKQRTGSAFWTTTPFQIMGAAQQLGRDLDAAAQSPLVAPVVGAVTFVGLTVAAFLRLRNGFDTSGFPILAQRLSAVF